MNDEVISTLNENKEKLLQSGFSSSGFDKIIASQIASSDSSAYNKMVVDEFQKMGFKCYTVKSKSIFVMNDSTFQTENTTYFLKLGQRFKIKRGGYSFSVTMSLSNLKGDLLLEDLINPFLRKVKRMFK